MATATFTSGTTPGIVIVTATETETGLSGTVEIILGGIKIDITTSTSKFVPTPCQTATIYFEIKPELVRDSPETNVSMIIKDKNGELVYNSSEDADAQVSKITAIWIGKNTTGEPVNPQLSNYTVEIIVNYRNMTINDTHNVTVLPNKVIVVVDEERMKDNKRYA
jgi:flagellar hook assembly protein FlgD